MVKFSNALLGGALLLSAAALPGQANAASGTGSGQAIIVTPTAFFLVENLNFGTIVPGSTAGDVVIDAVSGARSSGGGIAGLSGSGVQRARFVAGGTDGQQVNLTLSAPPTLDDGNGHTMNMTTLDLDGATTRTFDSTMAMDIYVGGTLHVGANQPEGNYAGDFTLTVDYL